MSLQQFANRDERFLRRYDYGTEWIVAAEIGVEDDDIDVDVVGETAIVVVETDDRLFETELELPGSDADVSVRNGILTLAGRK